MKMINKVDIALLILCVTLLALLPISKVADYDLFFHLRLGEHLWEHKHLYTLDEFSYTTAGIPQNTGEWLSNAALYVSYKMAGFYGLGILKSVLFLTAVFFIYKSIRAYGNDDRNCKLSLSAFVISLVVFAFAIRFRLDLRPYYFTYIFLSVSLFLLYNYRHGGKRMLYLLPIVQILWSNTHGGSILGPMLIGLFLAAEAIRQRQVPWAAIPPAVLVFAASLLTPSGIAGHWTLLGANPVSSQGAKQLGEWQSLTKELLWGYGIRYTLGYQILVVGAAVHLLHEASRKRFDPFVIALFAASIIYPLKSVRLISIASIMMVPMFYYGVMFIIAPIPLRWIKSTVPKLIFCAFIMYLIIFSVIKNKHYSFGFGPKEATFPDAALVFLDRNKIDGNVFNTVYMGSYMLWKSPHRKVFIDGRLVRSAKVNEYYDSAIGDMEGFQRLADEYDINYAVIDYDSKARWRFPVHLNKSHGWALVFWDNTAAVYLKNSAQNRRTIESTGYKILRPYFNDFSYLDKGIKEHGRGIISLIHSDIEKNPENQEAILAKAFAEYYLNMKDAALKSISNAISIPPDTAYEHIAMAHLLLEAGKKAEAESSLRHALVLEPNNDTAKRLLDLTR